MLSLQTEAFLKAVVLPRSCGKGRKKKICFSTQIHKRNLLKKFLVLKKTNRPLKRFSSSLTEALIRNNIVICDCRR